MIINMVVGAKFMIRAETPNLEQLGKIVPICIPTAT